MSKDDLVLFLDSVGRTIIGEKTGETDTTLSVKNPSVLLVQPNPDTGQIQVQLVPVFFKEFCTEEGTWEYTKANLTPAVGVGLDDKLYTQYNNMYSVIQAPSEGELAAAGADAPPVKLFDD